MNIDGQPRSTPRNKEEENLISNLYGEINKYKARTKDLTDALEKKKQEILTLKRQVERLEARKKREQVQTRGAPERPATAPQVEIVAAPTKRPAIQNSKPASPQRDRQREVLADTNLLEITKQYKNR